MTDAERFVAAVRGGDVDTVRNLLDGDGSLLRLPGPDGETLALTALYSGHGHLADELAARAGELSVFEAAAFDDTERLAELVRMDTDLIAAWSPDGWQPLHLAAYFGRVEAARLLLDADAPVSEPSRNPMAVHPLHAAAAGRHAELVWLLIASDAPVDARQQGGWTPLHSAAANGDLESIKALLAVGADTAATNDDGLTPVELTEDETVRAMLRGDRA
ncbi:MAG TPA: ankyrin repeat domain-containing protein [Jatrophihabitans sp.]|nr:ankyrin repeat domain-containing protein [Jatrophihabitans sp.]